MTGPSVNGFPVYDPTAICSRCTCDAVTTKDARRDELGFSLAPWDTRLIRRCTRCGHRWYEAAADSRTPSLEEIQAHYALVTESVA